MTDYLGRLAARTVSPPAVVRPRLPGRFEPTQTGSFGESSIPDAQTDEFPWPHAAEPGWVNDHGAPAGSQSLSRREEQAELRPGTARQRRSRKDAQNPSAVGEVRSPEDRTASRTERPETKDIVSRIRKQPSVGWAGRHREGGRPGVEGRESRQASVREPPPPVLATGPPSDGPDTVQRDGTASARFPVDVGTVRAGRRAHGPGSATRLPGGQEPPHALSERTGRAAHNQEALASRDEADEDRNRPTGRADLLHLPPQDPLRIHPSERDPRAPHPPGPLDHRIRPARRPDSDADLIPVVRVTIGRVEIRAVIPPPPPPAEPPRRREPVLSLAEYLRTRREAGP